MTRGATGSGGGGVSPFLYQHTCALKSNNFSWETLVLVLMQRVDQGPAGV